jgi:hypothetical protein
MDPIKMYTHAMKGEQVFFVSPGQLHR